VRVSELPVLDRMPELSASLPTARCGSPACTSQRQPWGRPSPRRALLTGIHVPVACCNHHRDAGKHQVVDRQVQRCLH
jgi:hypothetical protein